MPSLKKIKFISFIMAIFSWLLYLPILYPLPIFSTVLSGDADVIIWIGYLIMIVAGVVSTTKVFRFNGKTAFFFLSLSIVLYFILSLRSEFNVYLGIWDVIMGTGMGKALTWDLVITGGRGLWGGVQTLIYCFFIPCVFIFHWSFSFNELVKKI